MPSFKSRRPKRRVIADKTRRRKLKSKTRVTRRKVKQKAEENADEEPMRTTNQSEEEKDHSAPSTWLSSISSSIGASNLYSGCVQAVESVKDTLFPSRRLQRDLDSARERLVEVESQLDRLKKERGQPEVGPTLEVTAVSAPPPPPPPLPPPPPPLPSASRGKGLIIIKKARRGQCSSVASKTRITLEEIQNVKLRPSNQMKTRSNTVAAFAGNSRQPTVTLSDLKRVSLRRVAKKSPAKTTGCEAFSMQKSLRKVNICRSPGGTPLVTTTKDTCGEGLTPLMSKALKRRFKNARSPSLSPHPETSESPTSF